LILLKTVDIKKINFISREPFLDKQYLKKIINYCKKILYLKSVFIIINNNLITRKFLARYARNIDILAIFYTFFNKYINIKINRGSSNQVLKLYKIQDLYYKHDINFKLNIIVY
ncbi:hypothetical protein BO94DRAFT_477748, partial [Aspergillus sclerotioniger CBS 115572]